jgi:hypothetical protein
LPEDANSGSIGSMKRAVLLRVVPMVLIAVCASVLCAQSACSGNTAASYTYTP